jgi:hypothetical protein
VAEPSKRPDPGAGKSLSRREFDEVIRRASELSARETETGEGALEEAELMRIAREVGLPDRHVRAALMELRTGATMHRTGGTVTRFFGPETVRASRVVPGDPHQLAEKLDTFLVGGQLLQSVRRTERLLQYRPAVDWASQVARMASAASRSYYVAAARSVEVRLEEMEPGRTLVDFEVDPGTRNEALGYAVTGGFAGAAGGVGVAFAMLIVTAAPLALAVAGGTVIAAGIGGGFVSLAASIHRRKLRDVVSEVEGILDKLEMDESLEPPPPAWRQWVKRHFHGVANDFLTPRDK